MHIVKLMGANLLVQLKEGENKTRGGIVIPDSAEKHTLSSGIVKAKGKGYLLPSFMEQDDISALVEGTDIVKIRYIPLDVNEGDVVFFKKDYADTIMFDGIEYYVVSISHVLLTVASNLDKIPEPFTIKGEV